MCMIKPKIPDPVEPAAPPPPPEKSVESLDLGDEMKRRQFNARSGVNKLKINKV